MGNFRSSLPNERLINTDTGSTFNSMQQVQEQQDVPVQEIQEDGSYVMVAALDFGTACSGYAFSFRTEPDHISMNKNWGNAMGYNSYKTPTCVLVGPQDELVEFGDEAEREYALKLNSDDRRDYHLFKQFKMMLMEKSLTRSEELTASDGYKMKAVDIFSMAIRYLKDHLLDVLKKETDGTPDESMIRWVITVPAIWTDQAKQFMREAVYKAGCIPDKLSKQLILALEPEAASIYARKLPVKALSLQDNMVQTKTIKSDEASFPVGTKYVIVDAGGGTTDITGHEILPTGCVREIIAANGGAWGSTKVDYNFECLLDEIFGNDFMTTYKKENEVQWLYIMSNFEKSKKGINMKHMEKKSEMHIALPFDISTSYEVQSGEKFESVIKTKQHLGLSFSNGFLVINWEACRRLFDPVISNIIHHVQDLLTNPTLKDIKYLVMVGGFAESPILQKEVAQIVPADVRLIIPDEAQLAVIKGAVNYGHNIDTVKERIIRKTCGVDMDVRFKEGIHDASKQVTRGDNVYCKDIFCCVAKKGDVVNVGDIKKIPYFPRHPNQPSMSIDIFQSDEANINDVEYIDNEKFTRVGGVTVMMPDQTGGMKREVEVCFQFGGTEIEVTATDKTSGENAQATLDMLLP